jgi:uncharacterized protein (DUF952 family)
MKLIYKILPAAQWSAALGTGRFDGAGIDLVDGYIHFSTAAQVEATARLHFAGQDGLVLVALDAERVSAILKWEPSRGGELFPHVYGSIDPSLAHWVKPLPWVGAGHEFPQGWRA